MKAHALRLAAAALALACAMPVAAREAAPANELPVHGVVRKIDRADLGRANAHAYVFLDVEWTFDASTAKRSRINGHVTLVDDEGRARLRLPWPLARSPALGRRYIEKGVGLALGDAGKAADWLATVPADAIEIRYAVTSD